MTNIAEATFDKAKLATAGPAKAPLAEATFAEAIVEKSYFGQSCMC